MARISKMHYSDAYSRRSGVREFLEIAVSDGEDPDDFTAAFYNSDGTLILAVPLSDPRVQVFDNPASGETLYVIQNGPFNILLTDPNSGRPNNSEAFALVDTDGTVIDFYDIGRGTQNITAVNGPAAGATSTNIPVPTRPNQATYSIQFNQPDPTQVSYETVDPGGSGVICFTRGALIRTPDG